MLPATAFEVFDPDLQRWRAAGVRTETALVVDVTGDGRDDLVLLTHDDTHLPPGCTGIRLTSPHARF